MFSVEPRVAGFLQTPGDFNRFLRGHGEFVIEGMSDQQSLNNKQLKELEQTNMVRMCAAAWSSVLAHSHVAQFVIDKVC